MRVCALRLLGCAAIAASMFLVGCSRGRLTSISAPAPPVAAPLEAPAPIAPPDQSTFTNYPRTIRFQWSQTPRAASYAIEIDCYQCCAPNRWCSEMQGTGYIVPDLKEAAYTFDYWGDHLGRWRVWAVDSQSRPGAKSAWSAFTFATGR